jgi:GNAT superfamily N-acetyltransferase
VERPGRPLFAQPLATWERDGLKAALARAGLPADDIQDDGPLFWRFERDDMPVGFAGIEVHGSDALLRSLVTLPPLRLQGVGGAMVDKMETEARAPAPARSICSPPTRSPSSASSAMRRARASACRPRSPPRRNSPASVRPRRP